MMRHWPVIVALLGSLAIPRYAEAQVVYFGIAGGYSLNNEALRLKGASTVTWLGVNHGFYAGPQLDFNLGKDFSIRTGLYFRKAGSDMRLDLEKLVVNLSQVSTDLEFGNRALFDYLQENPDLEIRDGLKASDLLDGIDTYHEYVEKAVETLKGTDVRAKADRYNLVLPVLLRYTYGRLSFSAGVNLNLMVLNRFKLTANMPAGLVYSGKDLEPFLPYAHLVISGVPPTTENPKMSPDGFYKLDIAHEFTVGLQVGIDYAISDWISLQASYQHGLRSDIKAPWTDLCTLGDRAFQIGAVYHFHFKKKR